MARLGIATGYQASGYAVKVMTSTLQIAREHSAAEAVKYLHETMIHSGFLQTWAEGRRNQEGFLLATRFWEPEVRLELTETEAPLSLGTATPPDIVGGLISELAEVAGVPAVGIEAAIAALKAAKGASAAEHE
jgi:hypothetical protein